MKLRSRDISQAESGEFCVHILVYFHTYSNLTCKLGI